MRAAILAPARRLRLPVLTGPNAGQRLAVGGSSLRWLLGRSEPLVQRALLSLIRPGDTVLDIGANVGFYTASASRAAGPAGRVIAFEPNPTNAAYLRRNTRRRSNVTIVQAAATDRTGTVHLDVTDSLLSNITDTGTPVQAFALDDWLSAQQVRPDLVKIDVEGAECDVLRGMRATLADACPTLLIENHGRNAAVADLLDHAGYTTELVEQPGDLRGAPWWIHVIARPA